MPGTNPARMSNPHHMDGETDRVARERGIWHPGLLPPPEGYKPAPKGLSTGLANGLSWMDAGPQVCFAWLAQDLQIFTSQYV